jgi:hypothetical protein
LLVVFWVVRFPILLTVSNPTGVTTVPVVDWTDELVVEVLMDDDVVATVLIPEEVPTDGTVVWVVITPDWLPVVVVFSVFVVPVEVVLLTTMVPEVVLVLLPAEVVAEATDEVVLDFTDEVLFAAIVV